MFQEWVPIHTAAEATSTECAVLTELFAGIPSFNKSKVWLPSHLSSMSSEMIHSI